VPNLLVTFADSIGRTLQGDCADCGSAIHYDIAHYHRPLWAHDQAAAIFACPNRERDIRPAGRHRGQPVPDEADGMAERYYRPTHASA
jgi:hypothetical protein